MFLSSICSTLWSTYMTASGTATSSTPSNSNCIPVIVPVASSTRIWSTSTRMSCPASSSPSTRWLRSSLCVRFAGSVISDLPAGLRDEAPDETLDLVAVLVDEPLGLDEVASAVSRHQLRMVDDVEVIPPRSLGHRAGPERRDAQTLV